MKQSRTNHGFHVPAGQEITALFGAEPITRTANQSRVSQTRRSGNHGTNHGNHAPGDHGFPPLFREGNRAPFACGPRREGRS